MMMFKEKLVLPTKILNKITSTHLLFLGWLLIFSYFLPYFFLGNNSYITVHDNLDSNFVWLSLLAKTDIFSSPNDILPNIMNGLPMAAFPPKLNLTFLFFYFFHPLLAYLLNEFFVRFIAFIGMYLLLERHVLIHWRRGLSFCIAFAFSILPFYPLYGLSVAGQPLLLFAFLNILNKRYGWQEFAIIALFGFSSAMLLSGFFILFFASGALFWFSIRTQKFVWGLFWGIFTLGCSYIISEYSLFYLQFFSGFVSHRSDRTFEWIPLLANLRSTIKLGLQTQYHAGILSTKYIIASAFLSFFFIKIKRESTHPLALYPVTLTIGIAKQASTRLKFLFSIVIFILLTVFSWPYIRYWLGDSFALIQSVNFGRFFFLLPSVWMIIFAISLERLRVNGFFFLAVILIFLQFFTIIRSDTNYLRNVRTLLRGERTTVGLNFHNFYDEALFQSIAQHIGKNQQDYRVVSIGLHPSIAQYNGFYTLDGYQALYPLEYKMRFRKIIECELRKDQKFQRYFDDWGSRCYVFSSELGHSYLIPKTPAREINDICLDTKAFKEMGGEFIFSAVKITNPEANNLCFEGYFETPSSYWGIYLYKAL